MAATLAGVSVPIVKTLQECASYNLTVAPYWNELYTFPADLVAHITSLEGLRNVYTTTNPLISSLAISLLISPLFIIAGEVNKNYSQVDRFWSLLPTVYNAHYALWARLNGLPSGKVDNVAIFSALWSARLTYNYWRKGGYEIGSEDYRWEIIRKHVSPALFSLFNVVFIGFAQNVLLWSVTAPTYIILLSSELAPMSSYGSNVVFIRLLFAILGFEYVADQQQWDYYQARTKFRKSGEVVPTYRKEDLERGFNTRGLFAWSRHPNFACEQLIWFTLYAWGAYTAESYKNWTVIGALAYHILFQASTWFTETISAGKYPDYKTYQKNVGMFLPRVARPFDLGDFIKKPAILERVEKVIQEDATK